LRSNKGQRRGLNRAPTQAGRQGQQARRFR
jgi:hypothetical protein